MAPAFGYFDTKTPRDITAVCHVWLRHVYQESRKSEIESWNVCLKCSISKYGEYVGFMPSTQEFLILKDWEKNGSAHFESARIDGADIWEFDTSVTSQALFHSWLHHLCQESRKPEIEMFDVYFKCCSHWLPCKIFEISPSWGLRHRTIYSCIFLGFGWVWSSCHLFPWYFGGFLEDPAFSAVFWGDLQPLLGGCAIYSCLFGVWLGLHVLHSVLVDFLGIPPFQSAVFWGDLQPILGVAPSMPVLLVFTWFAWGMEHLFPQCFDGLL